jgi:hypothetical protein
MSGRRKLAASEKFIWVIVLLGLTIGASVIIALVLNYWDSVIRPRRNLRRRDMQLKRLDRARQVAAELARISSTKSRGH